MRIPADPVIVRQGWLRAYDWTTDRGAAALNDYARSDDPFAKVGHVQIAVEVSSVIRASRRLLPRRLGRAAVRERPARAHRALDRDPDARAAAAPRRGAAPRQPPRHLRQRHQLVPGDGHECILPRTLFASTPFATVLLASALALAGCADSLPPEIGYDADVPPLPPAPITAPERARPPRVPPSWSPTNGGPAAATPTGRVENANAAARVEPRREGYYNAIQVYPWSEGALYQVYAAPGRITDIALEPGEDLSGAGPIAAGDTARWIIGDTVSGSGGSRRVHILLKPIQPDIRTNLVITTNRRTYLLELRSGDKP